MELGVLFFASGKTKQQVKRAQRSGVFSINALHVPEYMKKKKHEGRVLKSTELFLSLSVDYMTNKQAIVRHNSRLLKALQR